MARVRVIDPILGPTIRGDITDEFSSQTGGQGALPERDKMSTPAVCAPARGIDEMDGRCKKKKYVSSAFSENFQNSDILHVFFSGIYQYFSHPPRLFWITSTRF